MASNSGGHEAWPWLRLAIGESRPYVKPMAQPNRKRNALGMAALLVPLFAILVAAIWFGARAWTEVSGPPMPAAGYVAMTLGVVFSLLVGCGLMALLFYSSRHGYDEQLEPDRDPK